MSYGFVIGGLVLLYLGGEGMLKGAVGLAGRLGVSPLLIGLTVVAFATSAPELTVTIKAALMGNPDIAVGNVVGSNIANILLILGMSALLMPLGCRRQSMRRDANVILAATAIVAFLAATGSIERWNGLMMVGALVAYIIISYLSERSGRAPISEVHIAEAELVVSDRPPSPMMILLFLAFGLGALVAGADLMVRGAVDLGRAVGVPEAVIGLSVVAIGTSLPELATSMVAAYRGKCDVAIANVVGSNLFNILGILGIAAIIRPLPITDILAYFDVWIMLAVTLILLPFLYRDLQVNRLTGGAFLTAYLIYIYAIFAGWQTNLVAWLLA